MIPLPVYSKEKKRRILRLAKESIIENSHWISQLEKIIDFLELYPFMHSPKDVEMIKDKVSSIVDDYYFQDDYEMLDDELYRLKNLQEKYKIPVSEEIGIIESRMEEIEADDGDGHDPDWEESYGSASGKSNISDAEISSMFSTLAEE